MSDWEGSGDEKPAKQPIVVKKAKKWEGEDEEESEPASDWEESSEEEEEKPAAAPVAPPKKKGTLKAKLAEKEAAKAARIAAGEDDDDDDDVDYDEDEVLDPREKARRDREREVNADLSNAAELFGAAALGGTSSAELNSIISFQPRTKEDFHTLSSRIIEYTIKRHQNKPLYAAFVEHHVRQLAMPLKDVEIRKAASGLTTLANEKQKEQREKASGKKKAKATTKPALGAAKASNRLDTNLYDESLDDFGANPDDFM
ncbi:translation initiation factor eIF3 subunit [Pleurotus eryngii]|uniref:Eukaryotic translation initiation factor 3 subunit J n=1 Tax=Pleurotus eryngii TaxID=5323 RepID=A0A9P5ZSI0_PLEER|nr:translation initiation factor eIF3 subunit [Pleurotus eryngii]